MFNDLPEPLNGLEGWRSNKQKVGRGAYTLKPGRVVNVKDHHHVTQHYDVEITSISLGGRPIILPECRRGVSNAGFDGVGTYEPLEEGTPVILLMLEGVTSDAVILSSTYSSGDSYDFLIQGEANKPNSLFDGPQGFREANQPSVYPTRLAQPDSVTTITGSKVRTSDYDDPRFHTGREEKVKARPQIGAVEIKTKGGDLISYSTGTIGLYADKDLLFYSKGANEGKCTRLMRHAAYYTAMYKLILKYMGMDAEALEEEKKEDSKDGKKEGGGEAEVKPQLAPITERLSGISSSLKEKLQKLAAAPEEDGEKPKPPSEEVVSPDTGKKELISPYNLDPQLRGGINFGESMPIEYHLDQVYKLAMAYRKAAEGCNQGAALTQTVASTGTPVPPPSTSEEEKKKEGEAKTGDWLIWNPNPLFWLRLTRVIEVDGKTYKGVRSPRTTPPENFVQVSKEPLIYMDPRVEDKPALVEEIKRDLEAAIKNGDVKPEVL